jgi:hypothetical protein
MAWLTEPGSEAAVLAWWVMLTLQLVWLLAWCGCCLGVGRPVIGLVEGVGWLNPVGRYGNRPATREDLESLLLP